MNFLEKMLKKRLDGGASRKGVEVEELWASIENALPAEDKEMKPVASPRHHQTGWWLAAVLFLVLAGGVAWLVRPKFQAATAKEEKKLEQPSAGVQLRESVLVPADDPVLSERPSLVNGEADVFTAPAPTSNRKNTSAGKTVPGPAGTRAGGSTPAVTTDDAQEGSDPGLQLSRPPGVVATLPPIPGEESAARSTANLPLVTRGDRQTTLSLPATIATLAPLPLPLRQARLPAVQTIGAVTIDPVRQRQRARFEAGFFAGTNWLRPQYASSSEDDLGATLNGSRGQALGQSLAIDLSYRIHPAFRLISGVALARTHTTFRYTESWDTTTVFNGRPVNAIALRRVTHNNFQTQLSVPLLVEASAGFGRLEAGIGTGIAFSVVSRQTGRFLNAEQEVVTYGNGEDAPLPVPNSFLAYVVRPQLTYRISPGFSVQAQAEFRWQQYGTSALSGVETKGAQLGASLGVLYGFGKR